MSQHSTNPILEKVYAAQSDAALDDLRWHQMINDSGWAGRVVPTYRPDAKHGAIHILYLQFSFVYKTTEIRYLYEPGDAF